MSDTLKQLQSKQNQGYRMVPFHLKVLTKFVLAFSRLLVLAKFLQVLLFPLVDALSLFEASHTIVVSLTRFLAISLLSLECENLT